MYVHYIQLKVKKNRLIKASVTYNLKIQRQSLLTDVFFRLFGSLSRSCDRPLKSIYRNSLAVQWLGGFPGGSMIQNPPAKQKTSSISGLGRAPGESNGNPLQYSCLGNPMNRGAWRATVHGVTKELDMTWRLNNNQWLGFCAFTAKGDGLGSISGWELRTRKPQGLAKNICILVDQSCPTLRDSMNCSSPSSSVHGILQTKILEWVAVKNSL